MVNNNILSDKEIARLAKMLKSFEEYLVGNNPTLMEELKKGMPPLWRQKFMTKFLRVEEAYELGLIENKSAENEKK